MSVSLDEGPEEGISAPYGDHGQLLEGRELLTEVPHVDAGNDEIGRRHRK